MALTSGAYIKPSGWAVTDPNFNNSDATSTEISVEEDGIYFVSFTPMVSGLTTGFRARININGTTIAQGRMSLGSTVAPSRESMPLSLAMSVSKSDVISFEVQADNAGMALESDSSRSLLEIDVASSNLTEGMSGVKLQTSTFSSGNNAITGWDTSATPGSFLAKNVSITNVGTLAVLRAGVFRVTAHILVLNRLSTRRYIFCMCDSKKIFFIKG